MIDREYDVRAYEEGYRAGKHDAQGEIERLRKALLIAAENLEYWGGYVDSDIAIAALEGREPPIK